MSTEHLPVLASIPSPPAVPESRAAEYAKRSKAASTRRAYEGDWADFCTWCADADLHPLPAEVRTVCEYLAALADRRLKVSTIERRRAAIRYIHQLHDMEPPTRSVMVDATVAGIRREVGTAQQGKSPILLADLRQMVMRLPNSLHGVRDRAILLVGFAGAFRRSELVALELADIEERPEGLRITIRRSKTDQEGKGRLIGIPKGANLETCPVRAFKAWLTAAGITAGAVFQGIDRHGRLLGRLSGRGVARAVKAAAVGAQLDPGIFSGHSMRAGLATAASAAGVGDRTIMRQTGHKRRETLDKYIREGDLWRDNAAKSVGL